MNPKYHLYEEIDLYLQGKLEDEKAHTFKERLQSDPEFSKLVEAQKITHEVIKTKKLAELRDKIRQDLSTPPTGNPFLKKLFLIPPVLLAIGTLSYFGLQNENEPKITVSSTSEKAIVQVDDQIENTEEKSTPNEKVQEKFTENKVIADKSDTIIENQIEYAQEPITDTTHLKKEPVRDSVSVQPSKEKKTTPKPFDCSTILIQTKAESNATCKGKPEGSIIIDKRKITGGEAPYYFSINGESGYSENLVYDKLKSGTYILLIKDKHGCTGRSEITVEEKNCQAMVNEVLNPYHSNWKIPTENRAAELKIINKAGVLVYSKQIEGGQPEEWDGKDTNGQLLENGLYLFQLEYKDGSIQKGYITIMY